MDDFDEVSDLLNRYHELDNEGRRQSFNADEFYALAEYFVEEGNYDEAMEVVELGINSHPESQALFKIKGRLMVIQEHYQDALDYLEGWNNGYDLDITFIRAEALLKLGRKDEIDSIFTETAIQELTDDEMFEFFSEMGFIFNDAGLYDLAILFFENSFEYDDSDIEVLNDIAYAHEMKGDYADAIKYINRILDIDPYSLESWEKLIWLYSIDQQFDKMLDSVDFALAINEDDAHLMKLKAMALYMNENFQESIEVLRKCISLSPKDKTCYDMMFEVLSAENDYEGMLELLDLQEMNIGKEDIDVKRGMVYFRQESYEKARSIYEGLPDEERDGLNYYFLEGELAFEDKDYDVAESSFLKATLLYEDNVDIVDRLADVSIAKQDYAKAEEYLEKLLKMMPDYLSAKTRLAIVRFEMGYKQPFNDIIEQFSDDELRELTILFFGYDKKNVVGLTRDQLIKRFNDAREKSIVFKNLKY